MIKNRFQYQSNRSMIEINTMHAYFFIASKFELSYLLFMLFNSILSYEKYYQNSQDS